MSLRQTPDEVRSILQQMKDEGDKRPARAVVSTIANHSGVGIEALLEMVDEIWGTPPKA